MVYNIITLNIIPNLVLNIISKLWSDQAKLQKNILSGFFCHREIGLKIKKIIRLNWYFLVNVFPSKTKNRVWNKKTEFHFVDQTKNGRDKIWLIFVLQFFICPNLENVCDSNIVNKANACSWIIQIVANICKLAV